VDWAVAAAEHARVILVEVNENMPRTSSSRRLHRSRVTASLSSSRRLADSPARPPSSVEIEVARNVAALIPSGATIQLGASALAEAIGRELRDRRSLRVRSGLVGDWLVELYEAGALDDSSGSIVTGMALGSEKLYDFVNDSPIVRFAPIDEQIAPAAMAQCRPYISVNSAIEVDLIGQVNSEVIGGRYVGAVGGQMDFFRAARASESGIAVVALSSTSPSGAGRIVSSLSGPVTSPKSDVDVVVTEWGSADIAAASFAERAERLAEIAHPDHRDQLRSSRPAWI
jgi:acyl-CoA hydrolase